MPLVLQRVTGSIKGEGGSSATGDGTSGRRGKKRKVQAGENVIMTESSTADVVGEGWSQTGQGQGEQEFSGQNVDPGLQMPQES